ncbi:MAG: hypothetical protein GY867_03160 [bacterium]|nr:hypothetical protein [bacterium]
MFGIENISIDFLTGSPVFVWLALVVMVGLSVWLYLRTNPPLSLPVRLLLGFLRLVAVLALAAALFEPVISYTQKFERPRRVAVLLDRSASMDRVEDGKSRRVRLDSLLSSGEFERLRNATNLNTWYFGSNLDRAGDKVGTDKTAIGEAVRELEQIELAEPSDYWLMFSDGNANSGLRPSEAAAGKTVPIHTVGLAGAAGDVDVSMAEVDFNPVVFVGKASEIKVKLSFHSAAGRRARVKLSESGRPLTEDSFDIIDQGGYGEVTLKYVPDAPGQKLLRIEVPQLEGETAIGNNHRTIAVKVLKSRLAVLLAAEKPDYEVGFLNRYLRKSDRFDVDLLITGRKSGNLGGRFPAAQAEWNRYDLIVLYDPDPNDIQTRQTLLDSYLKERGGGVWLLMGPQFAARGPQEWAKNLLPFYPGSRRSAVYSQFQGVPAEGHLFHPAVRLADDRSSIRERWSTLPPFEMLISCDQIAAAGTVLAFSSGTGTEDGALPLLGYRRLGPGKLIASAALPFWSWGFKGIGYGTGSDDYARLVEGLISWLTVQDDFDPIRISPEREVFSRGEPVRFEGFAFDQGFRPIPGVTGVVKLTGGEGEDEFEADLIQRGEGKFAAEFTQLPPGRYVYEARFEKEGRLLKERTAEILIESFSLEEYDQRGDPAVLQAISRASGGNYTAYRDFARAASSLDIGRVEETEIGEIDLWGKLWLLLVFVGALALEWFLRKANHLI